MKIKSIIQLVVIFSITSSILLSGGCAFPGTEKWYYSHLPSWSKASVEQRANGDFVEDDAYMESPQFMKDMNESVDTIIRLKAQRATITNQPSFQK
jgi:hypothetical protein